MTTVRPARPGEADAIYQLHRASILAFGPEAYDDGQVDAWAGDPDAMPTYPIDDEDHVFVVADRAGELAGFGDLHHAEREVTAVYVHPDHAGAGVGTELLDHLEDVARSYDIDTLGLLASRNAVGFYAQAGYRRVETRVHETAGAELECVWMETSLC